MDLSRDNSIDRSFHLAPGSVEAPPAVDLRNLFRKLWFFRYRIVAATVVSGGIGYWIAQQLDPTYTASTSILLGEIAFSSDVEEAAQLALFDSQRLSTAIEVFQSSQMLGKVAEALDREGIDLAGPIEPESAAAGGAVETLGTEQRRRQVVETLRRNLLVRRMEESSVINLSYTSYSPEIPAPVVNLLVDQYIDQLRLARDRSRDLQIEWLNHKLEELEEEIQAAERAVEERRAELSVEAGQGLEIMQRSLTARADELSQIQSDAARLSIVRDKLFWALGSDQPIQTIPEFRDSPVVQEISNEIRELENRIESLPEGSPGSARAALEGRIERRREDIRDEALRIAEGVSQDLIAARQIERSLTAQVRELENQVQQMTTRQLDLRQLELEADVRRSNYEALSVQLLNTSKRMELQPIRAQVLSRAETPQEPDEGRGLIITLLCAISGFLFAAGWVILRDVFSDTFRSVAELEGVGGTHVVGRIPRVRERRPQAILQSFLSDPRSPLADAIRSLCINIGHLGPAKKASVFLFTGPLGSEGTSTLALLTAVQLQRLGQPTLLLDCSATGETINAALQRDPPSIGIQTVLKNPSTLDAAIVEASGTNLSILSWNDAGVSQMPPSDAFQRREFSKLLDDLTSRYANIIIDADPVLTAPDAKSIAELVDSVFLVIRWDRTPRMALLESIEELASVGQRPACTVLNIVNEKKARAATPWRGLRRRARPRMSS